MADKLEVEVEIKAVNLKAFTSQVEKGLGGAVSKLGLGKMVSGAADAAKGAAGAGGGAGMAGAMAAGAVGGAIGAGIMMLVDSLKDFPMVVAIMKLFKLILMALFLPLIPILKPVMLILAGFLRWWFQIMSKFTKWLDSEVGNKLLSAAVPGFALMDEKARKKGIEDLKKAWEFIANAGKWIWENILLPAFGYLSLAGKWIWDTIILPAFGYLKEVGVWIWERLIAPAWGFISQIPMLLWTTIIMPAFSVLKDVGLWIWEKILKPAWNVFKDLKVWIWDGILKKAWDSVAKAFQSIVDAIKKVVSNILGAVSGALGKVGGVAAKWVSGSMPSGTSVGGGWSKKDFVVTPNGTIKTDPNDFIIGTKTPGALGRGGGGISVIINSPSFRGDDDIKKLVGEIEKRLGMEQRRRVGYV